MTEQLTATDLLAQDIATKILEDYRVSPDVPEGSTYYPDAETLAAWAYDRPNGPWERTYGVVGYTGHERVSVPTGAAYTKRNETETVPDWMSREEFTKVLSGVVRKAQGV